MIYGCAPCLDRDRPSREVRRIAEAHVGDLEARIAEMQAMAKTPRELVHECHGDDRPDCRSSSIWRWERASRALRRRWERPIATREV